MCVSVKSKFISGFSVSGVNIRFTSEEVAKFNRRIENGFDIASDKNYNAWLKINHPAEYQRITGNLY